MTQEQINYDKVTYYGIMHNENYASRLKEAYSYLKFLGINTLEEFTTREGLNVGAFTYDEITIFDRIKNEEYCKVLAGPIDENDYRFLQIKDNPNLGDQLASWGTLGKTPNREDLINRGFVVDGMTANEQKRHFGA